MKLALILITIFISISGLTHETEDPSIFCSQNSCTEKMQEISVNYKIGNGDFAKKNISGYSGTCYHINPIYKPEYPHYGVMVFENKNKQFLNTGFWGFFYTEDPYLNMTPEEIQTDLENKKYASDNGEILSDHTELAFLTAEATINYWFKSSSDLKKLFVIGRWQADSGEQFMFCELDQR